MKFISFEDVKGVEHIVNLSFIVELCTNRWGNKEHFNVCVSNAGASFGEPKRYEVSEDTYEKISRILC